MCPSVSIVMVPLQRTNLLTAGFSVWLTAVDSRRNVFYPLQVRLSAQSWIKWRLSIDTQSDSYTHRVHKHKRHGLCKISPRLLNAHKCPYRSWIEVHPNRDIAKSHENWSWVCCILTSTQSVRNQAKTWVFDSKSRPPPRFNYLYVP